MLATKNLAGCHTTDEYEESIAHRRQRMKIQVLCMKNIQILVLSILFAKTVNLLETIICRKLLRIGLIDRHFILF